MAQGLAVPVLLLAVPSHDGGLEDAPLVAYLLMQWDVASFDAGHDVGSRDTDQVSGLLGAQYFARHPFGRGECRSSGAAADRRDLEEPCEVALDEPCGLGCQPDMARYSCDQAVDVDVH